MRSIGARDIPPPPPKYVLKYRDGVMVPEGESLSRDAGREER